MTSCGRYDSARRGQKESSVLLSAKNERSESPGKRDLHAGFGGGMRQLLSFLWLFCRTRGTGGVEWVFHVKRFFPLHLPSPQPGQRPPSLRHLSLHLQSRRARWCQAIEQIQLLTRAEQAGQTRGCSQPLRSVRVPWPVLRQRTPHGSCVCPYPRATWVGSGEPRIGGWRTRGAPRPPLGPGRAGFKRPLLAPSRPPSWREQPPWRSAFSGVCRQADSSRKSNASLREPSMFPIVAAGH